MTRQPPPGMNETIAAEVEGRAPAPVSHVVGDPIDAIKEVMAERGLTNVDLYGVFGAKSRVSEVLRRKRPLQVSHIRQLHNLLGIPYAKLVETYDLDLADRRQIDDEIEILRRLDEGDSIVFSQDGDMAWFKKGDRAFVGDAIMSLREKGFLSRKCDDEENYRGLSEYDTISEAGRATLAAEGPQQ